MNIHTSILYYIIYLHTLDLYIYIYIYIYIFSKLRFVRCYSKFHVLGLIFRQLVRFGFDHSFIRWFTSLFRNRAMTWLVWMWPASGYLCDCYLLNTATSILKLNTPPTNHQRLQQTTVKNEKETSFGSTHHLAKTSDLT